MRASQKHASTQRGVERRDVGHTASLRGGAARRGEGIERVRPGDAALSALVVVIWGLAFVVTKVGLATLSAPQLAAMRFVVAALPCALLARPRVPARGLIAVGLTLFAGQFLFQYIGIAAGMPAGLAAVAVQTQALVTVVLAAIVWRERPTAQQTAGLLVSLAGLGLIGLTVGADLTAAGLALTMVSPVSFAVGNILLKRLPPVELPSLVVWASLVPPLPALAVSLLLDGPGALVALGDMGWSGLVASLYLGLGATVVAYSIWGRLLRRYSAATVAPMGLLVPVVAAAASALLLGERFGPLRLAGMALVLAGVAVVVLPSRARRAAPASS
jgi:O-acetylserine/cysteine efflux transporter